MASPSQFTDSVRILPGEGEERVDRILASITDAFCAFDSEWRFTFLNEAARSIFSPYVGDPEQLLGQCYWRIFPETLGTNLEREFRHAVAAGVAVDFEYFHAPWEHWYVLRGFPIQGGGLSVYFRDVTEEKLTAAALSASEERYRSLFNAIDEGFCIVEIIWDGNGRPVDYRFVDVNSAFEGQTGLHNAVGKTARELVPELEQHWFDVYGGVASNQKAVRFVQGAESMGRWFDVYAFPVGAKSDSRVAIRCTDISEKRGTEMEMARLNLESRSRVAELETLLDVLPVGIGIALDRECRKIRVNTAFAQVLGLERDGNASKTAPEEERPANFQIIDDTGRELSGEELPMQTAAREGKVIRDLELNIVHADGRWIRLLEYAAPLFDDQGQPRGSVGAFVDITERMLAEARQGFLVRLDDAVRPLSNAAEIVATSARLLGEHLRADRCAYAEIEADEDSMNIQGDYTRAVPSIVGRFTFTQFGTEALRCMRADETYVVQDIEKHQPAPEDLTAYQATLIRAVICVPLRKDDRFVAAMAVHQKTPRQWTQAEVSLVRHVANRCWEALERVRVTRELEESEARFRQIADLTPQVVWLARPDGQVTYFNRRWYAFTGHPEGNAGDASWVDVLHPEDLPVCLDRWSHSVNTGEPYEIRYRWRDRAGAYRWFLGRALPLRDEHGAIVRWYGTSTDIDDLVRAEEAARQARADAERANRAKDDFLAALSHELRTPLTPVLMAAEALSEDASLDTSTRDTLCMIQRNIALEARLIDDLLDLTRISHGKLALRLQEQEVHSLIELALDIVRDEAQAKKLTLHTDFKAPLSRLQCDPSRLQQVFWNLLKNAVKFTSSGGQISVRTRNEGSQIVVEISDTGIGIARDKLGRIFLPFEQAGLANDHRFGGLGLGLSISKSLVELHAGSIVAASKGPGHGAAFTVVLPVSLKAKESPESAAGEMSRPVSPSPTESMTMRLLLVEDHAPTLTVLARLLARAGHHITTADSVATALEAASLDRFDGVISDVGLPDGTGMELMKTLHASYGLHGIALTGYGMEEDIKQAHESGFVVHLTKPVQFAQLRQALVQLSTRLPKL
ncbi:PAS domain S-box-containing protein [Prosthecobacter fusiformis]|uniref:histidine kinase n=1 Tax=Prosthecobacter fusiformis TaxID=48464 RepID=A0A4R7RMU1_9BACT|nr:PAS domain-containing protein [Prosthecobacter fusiformis]TDU66108.1 PAS domain S-box-containing protein [Prosthecobacter fusiformis]